MRPPQRSGGSSRCSLQRCWLARPGGTAGTGSFLPACASPGADRGVSRRPLTRREACSTSSPLPRRAPATSLMSRPGGTSTWIRSSRVSIGPCHRSAPRPFTPASERQPCGTARAPFAGPSSGPCLRTRISGSGSRWPLFRSTSLGRPGSASWCGGSCLARLASPIWHPSWPWRRRHRWSCRGSPASAGH